MTNSVIVLGGGIAGLSAAHELCERGFRVRVFEQRDVPGGKARSVVVPSTVPRQNIGTVNLGRSAAPTRRDLPGEHGFRFFPRFYRHIVDTMQRTPYRNDRSVADNLVGTSGTLFTRFDQPALQLPNTLPMTILELYSAVTDLSSLFGPKLGIAPEDHAFFGQRIWQILTSCEERRAVDYEKISWWDFVDAGKRSNEYQKFYAIGLSRSLVAARAQLASAKTIGNTYVQLMFNLTDPGLSSDRVLNGPTNDVWIEPWVDYLRSRGVEYNVNTRVQSMDLANGVVRGVMVERNRRASYEQADYFVAALPVEVMAGLITDEVLRADPGLASIFPLSQNVDWMNGIQFYLSDDVPIGRGHQLYVDSPWALTSISQKQFWPDVDLSRFGAGDIRGIISVVISDWDTPGLNGKIARACSRKEIRDEVWEQLKRSLNVGGVRVLEDSCLREWFLDLDVDPLLKSNAEPLLVNLVDTWRLRPRAVTEIANLFLAGDYIQTYTDLATMEGANEAARRAVNGILEHSGVSASPCPVWNLHEPGLLEPWRAHDLARYRQGLAWDDTLVRVALDVLAALQRGATALEGSIRQAVASATHVEDLVSYLRPGQSRPDLIQRITSGDAEQAGELLRAFVALARAGGWQPEASVATALDAFSAGPDLLGRAVAERTPTQSVGRGVYFVDR